jgi:predicted AAA+ superfamily ATPase
MSVYLKRTAALAVEKASSSSPVLLLTGMRQVGKSTLLRMLAGPERKYVTLDDVAARVLAKEDPQRFLQENPPPVIIDEIQYAPELLPYIKIWVDEHRFSALKNGSPNPNGAFWLTGSQKYHLMQGIQESLAGRVAILDLLGLSCKEMYNLAEEHKPFLPRMDDEAKNDFMMTSPELFYHIWQGSFPELVCNHDLEWNIFYQSYVQTYIARDVKDFYKISNDVAFYNFLVAAAARTGELLNYTDLARDVHIDVRTVKQWLGMLERSGVIALLQPYSRNITKRVVKTPKLYFLDTGLACYLTKWNTSESLMNGAMAGHFLETWVFGELLKSYWHNGKEPALFFFRDANGVEIDFIIEEAGILYPLEVKKTAMPNKGDAKNFASLTGEGNKIGTGAILCLCPRKTALPKMNVMAIPVWEI